MNKTILQGNVVKDPEIKMVGETTVTNFSLAVKRNYKNKETGKYDADFFNCQVWGDKGNTIANYVRKGHQLLVSGRTQIRQYQAQDGTNRYSTEIVVEDFDLLNNREQPTPTPTPNNDFTMDVPEEEAEELELNFKV